MLAKRAERRAMVPSAHCKKSTGEIFQRVSQAKREIVDIGGLIEVGFFGSEE
jgi:hypothetical protein